MSNTKYFGPGIPEGYEPQQQRGPKSVVVFTMSEWAREAAHELDDGRRDWVVAQAKDEYAAENLSNSQVVDTLDHLLLLMRWDLIKEYRPQVVRDYQQIEAYLGNLKANVDYVARRRVSHQQWEAHRLALKEELAYKRQLLHVLKERHKQFQVTLNLLLWVGAKNIRSDLELAAVACGLLKKIVAKLIGFKNLDEADRNIFDSLQQLTQNRVNEELLAGRIAPYEGERDNFWE